jgi:hypothetical protein
VCSKILNAADGNVPAVDDVVAAAFYDGARNKKAYDNLMLFFLRLQL